MTRNEQLIAVVAFLFLMAALVFATWASPAAVVQVPSGGQGQSMGGSVGVKDVGTPGLMTNTPQATATIAATPTALSETLGQPQGNVRFGYTAAYTSGVNLIHGLTITPTACIANFIVASGQNVTITALAKTSSVFSMTTSSSNIPMYWVCGY